MSKTEAKSIVANNRIFTDLTKYQDFCREYGFIYNEADLYQQKNYIYRQYQKFASGKPVRDQWDIDAEKFRERQARPDNRDNRFSKPRKVFN